MILLALRNILRNRRRTLVTLFLVGSGTFLIAFMRFLTYGFNQDMIASGVNVDSGFLEIAAYGWNEKRSLMRALEMENGITDAINSEKGVRAVSYRIRSGALLSFRDKTRFISVLAADPLQEQKITTLHKMISDGAMPRDGSAVPEAAVGYRLARAIGMKPGDEFYLVTSQFDGSTGAMKFRLSGVFDTKNSPLDSGRVYITLATGEELFGTKVSGRRFYTSIALGVSDYLESERVKERLEEKFPVPEDDSGLSPGESDRFDPVVLDWRDLNPSMVAILRIATLKLDIFFVFFILSISFGVLNSVQMSIQERIRQFGVQLAIGTRTTDLFTMIASEIFFLLVPAVLLGTVLAVATGVYFYFSPIDLYGTTLGDIYEGMGYPARFRPIVAAGEVTLSIVGMTIPAFLVSLFSARRIFKLDPIQVINTI